MSALSNIIQYLDSMVHSAEVFAAKAKLIAKMFARNALALTI